MDVFCAAYSIDTGALIGELASKRLRMGNYPRSMKALEKVLT